MAQPASIPTMHVGILWSPLAMAGAAATVIDVLQAVNSLVQERTGGPPPMHWRWLVMPGGGAGPPPVPGAQQGPQEGAAGLDVIVIPGWLAPTGPRLRAISAAHQRHFGPLLQAHVARGGRIAACFNGSALLADAGLLAGREAALPWAFAPSIALQCGDTLRWRRDRAWHHDGPLWTTASLLDTLPAFLDLLDDTPAADLARAVATVLVHDPQRQLAASAALETPTQQPTVACALEQARRWLQTHRTEPYSLAATARAASTSPRTLLRWFTQVHGQTPLDYVHGLRIAQAQSLLQTTYLTVEAVARQCGYGDTSSFRKIFVRVAGVAPGAYRRQFQLRTARKQWAGPDG